MPAEGSSPNLTAAWGHGRSGLGATEGSPCRGGLGSLWSPIRGMSGGSGGRGSAVMAGSEQHQSLSLKQLKVPCYSFCLAPTAGGRRFWCPCMGLHACSGPRPGPPVTPLGVSITALSTVTVPSSPPPHSYTRPWLGWRGRGWDGVGVQGSLTAVAPCPMGGGREVIMRITGIPLNQVLAAHLAQPTHAWPCLPVEAFSIPRLAPSLPAIHMPTRGNSTQ